MPTHRLVLLAACASAWAVAVRAADWPQWRGPDRSGVSAEAGLLKQWPKGGPELAWSFENAGTGYGSFAVVVGGKLICRPGGPKGLFAALDKKTGDVLWRSAGLPDACTYSSPIIAEVGGVRQYVALVQTGAVGVSARDGSTLWEHRREEAF